MYVGMLILYLDYHLKVHVSFYFFTLELMEISSILDREISHHFLSHCLHFLVNHSTGPGQQLPRW